MNHKTSAIEPLPLESKNDVECCEQIQPKFLWKENCPPRKPWVPFDSDLTPLEIERRYESAVVRVFTQTLLTGYSRPSTVPVPIATLLPFTGADGQNVDNTYDTYTTYGNGFRVKGGFIVVPAHLVLLPPNLAQYYASPITQQPIIPSANGDTCLRVGRILLDIFNVNGSGYSFTYEAQLMSVDGVNDVALLYIPAPGAVNSLPSNSNNPIIKKCHPCLYFGCSRQYRNTEPAYVLGDVVTMLQTKSINQNRTMDFASRGVLSTTVTDYKHVDYSGLAQSEMVLLNGSAYAASGCPILNKYGRVIAMQTLSPIGLMPETDEQISTVGDGKLGGISQFSLARSIMLLDGIAKGKYTPQAKVITDPVTGTSFWLLDHAYLGVAWDLVTAATYGAKVDSVSGTQLPRVDLSYRFLQLPDIKEVVGVRVRALAGDQVPGTLVGAVNNVVKYIAVPGNINPANPSTDPYYNFISSPLIGQVFPNDIIYEINCMKIGDLDGQAALSLALWALRPGMPVSLGVRVNTNEASYYSVLKSVNVKTVSMPNWVNFPWYKYHDLPVSPLFGNYNLQTDLPFLPVNTTILGAPLAPYFPSI